ncbi:hypothetical protein [Massilia sp. BSC265]|uniref:hypothetical protein n=1 Tax=Massilia sp. BSC265 TaxID=1549812 RepID=UPI00126A7049|nr:hypothetical protein [Massilia sp. BSC265]
MLIERIEHVALHPAVLAIAVELIIYPDRRSKYSDTVLSLAREAIFEIEKRFAEKAPPSSSD